MTELIKPAANQVVLKAMQQAQQFIKLSCEELIRANTLAVELPAYQELLKMSVKLNELMQQVARFKL